MPYVNEKNKYWESKASEERNLTTSNSWRPRGAVMRYDTPGCSFAASAVKEGISWKEKIISLFTKLLGFNFDIRSRPSTIHQWQILHC